MPFCCENGRHRRSELTQADYGNVHVRRCFEGEEPRTSELRLAMSRRGPILIAGGGGFILFIAPPESRNKLDDVFSDKHRINIRVNAPGSQIVFAS